MIWHYLEHIQFDLAPDGRCANPFFLYDLTALIRGHLPISDNPKQTFLLPGTYGYEICSSLRIIVSLQADAAAMVFFRNVLHQFPHIISIILAPAACLSISRSCFKTKSLPPGGQNHPRLSDWDFPGPDASAVDC